MAVRFDLAKLEVIGQPVALVENVMQAFSCNVRATTLAPVSSASLTQDRSFMRQAASFRTQRIRSCGWIREE